MFLFIILFAPFDIITLKGGDYMNELQLKEISQILSELITGSEITIMLEALNLDQNLSVNETKWKRIYNAIALSRTYESMIKIIEYIMTPSRFTETQNNFAKILQSLNLKLAFLGFQLLPTGKVVKRQSVKTLDEATQLVSQLKADLEKFNIHPQILLYCRPEIISENLFHLVLESSKCVLNELKVISGLEVDGNTLINQCFDGKNPLVIMNTLTTETEWSEHKGLKSMLNTIVYLYRNPKAHIPKYLSQDTYQSTLEALIVISRCRYALEKCFRNNT